MIRPTHSAAGADHRHRRSPVHQPTAPRGQNHGIGREAAKLHRDQILTDRPPAAARRVEHRLKEVPELPFLHLSLDLKPPHLLIECIEKLLAGGRAGKGGSFVEGAPEATLIAKPLGRAIEGYPQPIHQIDDPGAPVGHLLHRRLVLEEVSPVDGVVKMLPLGIPLLTREGIDAVDAPLRTDTVRACHRHEAHEIDLNAQFGQTHGGRESGETAANNENTGLCHGCQVPVGGSRNGNVGRMLIRGGLRQGRSQFQLRQLQGSARCRGVSGPSLPIQHVLDVFHAGFDSTGLLHIGTPHATQRPQTGGPEQHAHADAQVARPPHRCRTRPQAPRDPQRPQPVGEVEYGRKHRGERFPTAGVRWRRNWWHGVGRISRRQTECPANADA